MIPREEKHLFQIKYPMLGPDEEEIFYHHPNHDVKCNQIGMVYPGPTQKYFSYSVSADKYSLNDGKLKTSIPRLTLITQCFTGEIRYGHRSLPLDGNPYNTSYLNLAYPLSLKQHAKENYKNFIKRTVDYMIAKNKKLKERGINPVMYWGFQKLHPAVKSLYASKTGTKLVFDSHGIPKVEGIEVPVKKNAELKKSYKTKEEIAQIRKDVKRLYAEDVTIVELAKKYDTVPSNISYYLRSKDFVPKNERIK